MIKRILSFVIVIAVLICMQATATTSYGTSEDDSFIVDATLYDLTAGNKGYIASSLSYEPGDIDFDGLIAAKDILKLKKYLVGVTAFSVKEMNIADYSGNGIIAGEDLQLMLKYVAGISLDAPYLKPTNATVSYKGTAGAEIRISGGKGSVMLDLTKYDYSERDRNYAVVNVSGSLGSSVTAYASFSHRETAAKKDVCSLVAGVNSYIFKLPEENLRNLTGLLLSFEGNSGSAVITESYLCADLESALWIDKNRIAPALSAAPKVSCSLEGEKTAIRLVGMTDDDRNNTNGGMYHDFVNTKWPSIAVDEKDKLYVVGSGNRMAHIDPFGATILTTSSDGGKTWTKPQNISNTLMDDRDAGILYLGNGEMLVSYFTSSGTSYLKGGSNYSALKPYSQGGNAPNWAAEWDSSYNPKGGIIGTYLDMLSYAKNTDSSYNLDAASYVIKSTDYGKSWDADAYNLKGSSYTSAAGAMLKNYKITTPGTLVPVTSAHGPMLRSDGKILFAGKVMTAVDQPMDSMAVYISDDGLSWEYLSEIPTPTGYYYNNFHELSVTETKDGALLCAIRTQTCNDKVINPQATIYTCFSYDGGLSWTQPAPTGLDGTPPHLLTLNNGDVLLTFSDRTDPRSIRAVVSSDGGRTWSGEMVISENFFSGDDMGYPASAVLSDGTIVTVWYGTYKVSSANEQYSSIISKRWKYTVK